MSFFSVLLQNFVLVKDGSCTQANFSSFCSDSFMVHADGGKPKPMLYHAFMLVGFLILAVLYLMCVAYVFILCHSCF